MDYIEKSGKVTERMGQATAEAYKMVFEHTVATGERNVRFAQSVTDSYIKELRHQAEANRTLTYELVERAEGQRNAFQAVANEALDAWMDFLHAPLSYYKEGLRLVEKEVTGSLPLANYDEMNVDEISKKINSLSAAEIRELRTYEKQNKNRETLIEQFDRKLKAASA